jgi:D-arabinose 1-dehydrogenase-like Zn-dependent alcohol dehydrogenase
MKAVVLREPGGPEKLDIVDDWQIAAPGPGQVRVRVAACGVCYRDIVDREGKYPFMRRPVVTGHEWAGEIVAVGAKVDDFSVGDRVAATHRPACGDCDACKRGEETLCLQVPAMYGLTVDGGYAEEVLAWPGSLVKVPDVVPLDEAAFLHCTAAVALHGLRAHAQLKSGERVLITGASGGVGVHAVQVAKILGAHVVAVTGSQAKADALAKLGADEVVIAGGAELHKQVKNPVDVALELVGAPTFNGALRALRPGGRMVVIGNVTGERLEVNPGYLIMRQLALYGSAGASRAELADVFAWTAAGRMRPIVADRLPLAEARAAQIRMTTRSTIGRLVLKP